MKFKIVTSAAVLALMLSNPAYAIDASATEGTAAPAASTKDTGVMNDVNSGLNKANESMRDTADDIKAWLVGKNEGDKLEPVLIRRSMTAHGLVGEAVVNQQGAKIASVRDIIIDGNGKAILIVVSDESGFLGIGNKKAAFDYSKVVAQKLDGSVVMALSEDMVNHAADFSYDQKDWATAKVIPAGSISANALLKGNVLDSSNAKVASIENIYFRDEDVSQIIVGFNKTFGFGGDLAALDYDSLTMVNKNKSLDFRLTASQTAQFKNFRMSATN